MIPDIENWGGEYTLHNLHGAMPPLPQIEYKDPKGDCVPSQDKRSKLRKKRRKR